MTGGCGCQRPDWHEVGCLWQLDPDHRAVLSAALAVDRFKYAEYGPEEFCRLIARICTDPTYARAHAGWVTGTEAAA